MNTAPFLKMGDGGTTGPHSRNSQPHRRQIDFIAKLDYAKALGNLSQDVRQRYEIHLSKFLYGIRLRSVFQPALQA